MTVPDGQTRAMTLDVAVLGAGSWGTALAIHVARLGHRVRLFGRDAERLAAMAVSRVAQGYLDGMALPPGLEPVTRLDGALSDDAECRASRRDGRTADDRAATGAAPRAARPFAADLIVVAVPSRAFVSQLVDLAAVLAPDPAPIGSAVGDRPPIVWATKGLAPGNGAFLHEVFAEHFGDWPCGVLSGPSFAHDVARGLPTAVVAASRDDDVLERVRQAFHGGRFRVYDNPDVLGVELGGALKNVLAIAAGAVDGARLGANARAALITRGLVEMQRLGAALGARPETLVGLSGLGDLVLTCTDDQSRNRRFGLALGRGVDPETAARDIGQAVEGRDTARVALARARAAGVDMPIVEAVDAVLAGRWTVDEALHRLMEREPASELPRA